MALGCSLGICMSNKLPCARVCMCVCVLEGILMHSHLGLDHTGRGHRGSGAGFVSQALKARVDSVIPQGHKTSRKRTKEVLTQSPLDFPGATHPALEADAELCPCLAQAGWGGPIEGCSGSCPLSSNGAGPISRLSDREISLQILSATIRNTIRESTNIGSFMFPSWKGPYK